MKICKPNGKKTYQLQEQVFNLQWKDKHAMNYQTYKRLPAFYVTSFPKRLTESEFQWLIPKKLEYWPRNTICRISESVLDTELLYQVSLAGEESKSIVGTHPPFTYIVSWYYR